MLKWIAWNGTVLTFNWVKTKNILMLNWIVWNITVHKYKNGFDIKWCTIVDTPWNQTKLNHIKRWLLFDF